MRGEGRGLEVWADVTIEVPDDALYDASSRVKATLGEVSNGMRDGQRLEDPELARRLIDVPALTVVTNSLPVADIAADKRFANLTRIWLNGDHYKWRAMRANGVDERYITGAASDRESPDLRRCGVERGSCRDLADDVDASTARRLPCSARCGS